MAERTAVARRVQGDSEDEQVIQKLSREAAQVKALLDQYGTEFFPVYLEIMNLKNLERESVIEKRYDIGDHFVRVAKKNTLAEAAIGEATRYTRTQIRDYKLVASRITRAELSGFRRKKNRADEFLTWSHLYCLASVARDARPKVLQLVLDKCMTAGQLEDYIEAELPRKDRIIEEGAHNPNGRPFALPRSLAALLHATEQKIASADRYLETVVQPSFQELLRNTPPDKIDADTLQDMQELSGNYGELISRLTSQKGEIDTATAELAKVRGVALPSPGKAKPKPQVASSPPPPSATTRAAVRTSQLPATKVMPPGHRRKVAVAPKIRRK